MVIFHSYVSLPEGNGPPKKKRRHSQQVSLSNQTYGFLEHAPETLR